MKTLPPPRPDTPTLDQLRVMFRDLPADRAPTWGQMNPAQMLAHCHAFNRLCLGQVRVSMPVRWLARLLGPIFLPRLLARSAQQTPRNLATLGPLRAPAEVRFDAAKSDLTASIDAIAALRDPHRHPLYGRMRAVDVQTLARHHMAHHAHQFAVW